MVEAGLKQRESTIYAWLFIFTMKIPYASIQVCPSPYIEMSRCSVMCATVFRNESSRVKSSRVKTRHTKAQHHYKCSDITNNHIDSAFRQYILNTMQSFCRFFFLGCIFIKALQHSRKRRMKLLNWQQNNNLLTFRMQTNDIYIYLYSIYVQ